MCAADQRLAMDKASPDRILHGVMGKGSGVVYIQANQPSSSPLRVGAGSGAPGFVSVVGKRT